MSVMFRPPDRVARFRLTDYFSVGPSGDPFWRRVRRAQLYHFDRYLPYNLVIALLNGAMLFGMFRPRLGAAPFLWLALAHLLALVLGRARRLARRRDQQIAVGRRATQLSLLNIALVGCGWGVIFYLTLGHAADHREAMLVIVAALVGLGCLSFSTAVWPLGAAVLWGPVAGGTIGGLFAYGLAEVWPVLLLLLSFMLFMVRGTLVAAYVGMARIHLQQHVEQQEEVVRLLLNEFESNGSEWLFEFDHGGHLSFASSRLAEALGRPVRDVLGQHWTSFVADHSTSGELFDLIHRRAPFRDLLIRVEVQGEYRWWMLSGTPKLDREGRSSGYRGVGLDVTDRQRAAQRIAELATFDALTGLVNRRILHQTLLDALDRGVSKDAGNVALLFVDLDRFKAVNDSLGHAAGDLLLAEVAQRLRGCVVETGDNEALVGRLGGDEFAILLRDCATERAMDIGRSVIDHLSRPYRLGDKQVLIGASIGLAIGPGDGGSAEQLMRAADLAMYDAKAGGRGTVRCYDRSLHRRAEERRSLELDLRNAIAHKQLRLVFQPVVDSMEERIVGFEALLRWHHPQQGDIPPAVFVPLAEEAGLIGRLGTFVLDEACRVAAGWPRHIRIAVNVSPLQFENPAFPDIVRKALRRSKLPAERLELEMTESLFLDTKPQTESLLRELRAMGVSFALDDFGTGYSSLGYLQNVAFRRIKIDRSFVKGCVDGSDESIAIIQAIVALAGRLGIGTLAEGTENRSEFEIMRRLGCNEVQGYYFGRPMPADEVRRLLDRNRPLLELVDPAAPSAG